MAVAEREDVERWEPMCRSIVGDYFPPPGMTYDDLMQEARIGAFIGVRDFEQGRSDLPYFVAMCVRRRVLSAIKMATIPLKLRPLNESARVMHDPETGAEIPSVDLLPEPATTEEIIERREHLHDLGTCLRADLSLIEARTIIGLLNGESYAEIGERYGIGFKTVDNAIQRVRRKLTAALAKPPERRHRCPSCGGATRRTSRCMVCRVREERR